MQCLDIIHLKAFDSFFSDIRIPYPMWTLPLGRTEVHKILPWQSPPAVTNTLPGNITIIILASFRSLLFGYMFLMHLRIKKKIPWLYRKNRLRMWKRKTLLFWNQNSIIICSKLIETLKVTFLRLIQYMNLCNTIRKLLELPFTTFLKVFHVIFEKKFKYWYKIHLPTISTPNSSLQSEIPLFHIESLQLTSTETYYLSALYYTF